MKAPVELHALRDFAEAARRLSDVLTPTHELLSCGYPANLYDFDEVARDVGAWLAAVEAAAKGGK